MSVAPVAGTDAIAQRSRSPVSAIMLHGRSRRHTPIVGMDDIGQTAHGARESSRLVAEVRVDITVVGHAVFQEVGLLDHVCSVARGDAKAVLARAELLHGWLPGEVLLAERILCVAHRSASVKYPAGGGDCLRQGAAYYTRSATWPDPLKPPGTLQSKDFLR